MRLLDLFCGAGGAAMGYHRAGFEVVGVDINPQPRFPFEFHQADALEYPLDGFDVIHASPPCQAHTVLFPKELHGKEYAHPDLVAPTRQRLRKTQNPYVIENVPNAPLVNYIVLCGSMFGLKVYRHRLFESNILLLQPCHESHKVRTAGKGRTPKDDNTFWTVTGHLGDLPGASKAMGIDWMIMKELVQSIPPAYTEFIGKQLIQRPGPA